MLGIHVTMAAAGDDDLAEQALAGPRREGVDLSLVRRAPGPTGLSQIAVGPDGEKTIILALNANGAWAEDADRVAQTVAEAPAGSVLVADLQIPPALVAAAVRAARQAGLLVVLDPAPADRVPDDLLPLVDHTTPDHREAQTLTGIDASDPDGARRAAEQLRERGVGAADVKVSSGGSAVADQDGTTVVAGPADPEVVDATGGGDAYAGGLAWALCGTARPARPRSSPSPPRPARSAPTAPRKPTRPLRSWRQCTPGWPRPTSRGKRPPTAGSGHPPRCMTSQMNGPTVAGRLPPCDEAAGPALGLERAGPTAHSGPDRRREPWQGR